MLTQMATNGKTRIIASISSVDYTAEFMSDGTTRYIDHRGQDEPRPRSVTCGDSWGDDWGGSPAQVARSQGARHVSQFGGEKYWRETDDGWEYAPVTNGSLGEWEKTFRHRLPEYVGVMR